MSSASLLLNEDHFLCPICLNVFADPVTTPCGHNFCRTCIAQHWATISLCQCPMCNRRYDSTPELQVNTFISEMAAQFRTQQETAEQAAEPGEILCDSCTGSKVKAKKSCPVCLSSYCEAHLVPHLTSSGLKRHQLIDPAGDLESRMCEKHDKLLELFCRTDLACVCVLCTILDHKVHYIVPLREEYEENKAKLGKTGSEIQEMIQKRQAKIEEMKRSAELSQQEADKVIVDGVKVFAAIKALVEKSKTEFIKTIKERQRAAEKQAEDLVKDLEREISELKKRKSEVEQFLCSEDHFHFVQNFPTMKVLPPTIDWTGVSVQPPRFEGLVVRAVADLEEAISKDTKELFEAEIKRVRQYAVDVTLDHDTANPFLVVFGDGQCVKDSDEEDTLPDNPGRFDTCASVLGKQSFSSGRFYYEVQVKGKTHWELGVARESINRKGILMLNPKQGYWTICLSDGNEYAALADPSVSLSRRSKHEKVGVFVDYEEGLVSFYEADTAALIYSFTECSFTEKLYPYFGPGLNREGTNSAPLIIWPDNE